MKRISNLAYCLVIIGLMWGHTAAAQGGFRGPDETSRPASEPPPPLSPMTLDLATNPLATQVVAPKLLRLPNELSSMNYAHVMIAPGTSPIIVGNGTVNRGDLVATIPFRFRQMGQLARPLTSGRDGNGPVLIQAGALGYRINPFRIAQGEAFSDAWCFAQPTNTIATPNSRKSTPICLFKLVDGSGWVSAPERNAFVNALVAPQSRRANVGNFTVDPVSPIGAPEKQLELRFKNWSADGAVLEAFVDGQSIEMVTLPKKPNDEAELRLLTQSIVLSRSSARDVGARLTTTQRSGMTLGSDNQSPLDRLNQVLDENLVLWRAYHGRPGFEGLNTAVVSRATVVLAEALPQSRRFIPGQNIATQSLVPTQVFETLSPIATRAKRFGETGAILFRVTVETSMHVLCASNPADLPPQDTPTPAPARDTYCLEDSDNNNTYDTIWRAPTFAPGSRYHLLDLADPQKLSADAAQVVRVKPAPLAQLRPDVLNLTYAGPVYDPVQMRPGLVQLSWRYGEGPSAWPILAMTAHFGASGTAVFTTNSWKPDASATTGAVFAKISNIQLSGAADIQIIPDAMQDPTTLRQSAIESVVGNINQVAAARAALKPTP